MAAAPYRMQRENGSSSSFPKSSGQAPNASQEKRNACSCCPYGYHIDLDFVQYAAEEARSGAQQHDSLKLLKKPKTTTKTSKSAERYWPEEEEERKPNRKSVYENVPASSSAKRGADGGKTIKASAANSGSKLENQCLFSDSLENVVSDFEETLSRGGGAQKNKGYSSDYEMSNGGKRQDGPWTTKVALDTFQRPPALKEDARRSDGYASDYGYAVPTGAINRPSALNFATKSTANHYYASPSTLTATTSSSKPLSTSTEYAMAESTSGRLPMSASALSDSVSNSTSAYGVQNINGGISTTAPLPLKMEPSNSFGYETSRISNSSRPSVDSCFISPSLLTPTSELLSPRLLSSSPLPPKPSLGLSGRVGAQIEQLASHLNSSTGYGSGRESARLFDTKSDLSPTRRILELESRLRAIPGPAFGGEKRKLQDELNRLVNESKKIGYNRSITPTVLDTGEGGGYATALARAMSSVAAAERQALRNLPEPPPRRESVTRMQIGTVGPSSVAVVPPPRVRTYSANGPASGNGSLNLDAFHSYRRTNPLSNSSSSSTATASTIVRPSTGRSASAGSREEGDYVSDSEYALGDRSVDRFSALRRSRHLLSRPQSTLPPPTSSERRQEQAEDHHHRLVDSWRKEVEENARNGSDTVKEPTGKTTIIVGDGDDDGKADVAASSAVHAKPKPLVRTIGVVTDTVKPIQKSNASTCTAPLPQPKPCMDCDSLRQRVLELSVKPFTFTRGTGTNECTCDHCHRQSRLTFASVGCGTSNFEECRRDAATAAEIEIPCEECEKREGITKVSFGVSTTLLGSGVEAGTNTDFVEVRNRHANTDEQTFRTCSVNTDRAETKNAESLVDKAVLLSCGGYRTITSNTTPPLMVTFGVNTERVVGGQDFMEAAPNNQSSSNVPDDIKLRQTVEIGSARSVETREQGTSTDECCFEELRKQKAEKKDEVEKKGVARGSTFSRSIVRMVDKYVDSTVRTRDVGTRTPPPPPPPLQPLRSSSCQTINEIKTMVSIGSGDFTLSWSECDLCKGMGGARVGSESADQLKLPAFDADTQTETSGIDRSPSAGRNACVSTGCGPDEASSVSSRSAGDAFDHRSDSSSLQLPLDSASENASLSNASHYSRRDSDSKSDLANKEQSASNTKSTNEQPIVEQEAKVQRGIQRVFSPKPENRPEFDSAMWTSQTSATSDASSDRAADLNEESTVVCPLDDEEEKLEEAEEEASPKQLAKKFDFKKPRQTRAFALSKAAAAKKLLTSESGNGTQEQQKRAASTSASADGKPHQQSASASFYRSSVQSKSVRLDSKKGDSLAYITDKKHFQQQGRPSSTVTASKTAKPSTSIQTSSAGLKGKVVIKKNPPVRKVTPAPGCSRATATADRFKRSRPLPFQRRASSLPAAETASPLTTALKDEEAAAEAEDLVGPLPSEVTAAAAKMRWSASEAACYTNLAVENGVEEEEKDFRSTNKKLVGDVVENLPTKVERNGSDDGLSDESDSSERGDETEESLDEGSYDTNGNISSTCDVGVGDSTISEDSKTGDGSANVKFEVSPQLRDACNALNAYLTAGKTAPAADQVEWAQKFLQHEWLKTSASKRANPSHVGDFLDVLEDFSPQLLRHVVNFCDQNENTALHYAVSRGHFDIVSLLLDTKICNLNKPNKAGYTPVMLASLCPISSDTDSMVIQRLFQMGDVNIKASQHGQTALMLAVSHGNLETTKLLLEAGAGVNIQDEEGSTALMCAAEHGHKEIVRLLLAHPEIDASMTDNDKSTALSIAVDNDHKDIGILIYAHLNYERSPPSFQSQSAPVWC